MQLENQTPSQKLQYLIKNLQKIPPIYHSSLQELKKIFELNKNTKSQIIRIETFFNLTRPALCFLSWQNPRQQVSYPVAVIPLAKNQNSQEYSISLKFVTWVESGGTRCIYLRSNASQIEIEKYIRMSHCAVLYLSQQSTWDEQYKKFIQKLMQITNKEDYYPILFIGQSALLALQEQTKLTEKVQLTSQNWLSDIYVNNDSELMIGLDLIVRLQVQNLKKIAIPNLKLNISQVEQVDGLQVTARMKYRNQKEIVSIIENKQKKFYFIFNDTFSSEVPESIQLWHCAIANFIDLAKAKKKQVDQKFVQKHLIAHNNVVYKAQKGYYQTK